MAIYSEYYILIHYVSSYFYLIRVYGNYLCTENFQIESESLLENSLGFWKINKH